MFKGLSFSNGGLKTKLIVGGCLMAIVPIVVLGLMSIYNTKTTMQKESENQILTISKSIADMVDGVMTSESNAIAMLAQRDAVIAAIKAANAGDMQKADVLQQEFNRLGAIVEGRYEAISTISKGGLIIADNVKGKTKNINVGDRDYFKRVMQGKASLDLVVISKNSNAPICTIAHPVKDETGQVIGAVAGMLNVPFLAAKINEIKMGKTGYAFIVNQEGLVIVYPDAKQVLQLNMAKEQGMVDVMKRALSGESGVEDYDFKGINKFAGFAPVKANGWRVLATVPTDEMLAAVYATRNIMVIGVIIFALLAAVAAYFFARSIAVPIQRASEKLAAGAEQITAASGEVSGASQSLAEGASEQAAAIEETSSSLEEMSSMTKQNDDNANMANKLMDETKIVVTRANDSMKHLTGAMDEISKASEDTSKIIKTIDEIAFQTNLLALNAAVEAARAGEAGAGFAVVAEEVRNLAIRAADAARNTSGLIEGTIKKIKDGAEIVGRTNEDFSQVSESAGKVAGLIGEIAAASDEQAQGIGQIAKAVHEMDKVVQQNAANAEESASASEELNAQAVTMKDVVQDLVDIIGGSASGNHRLLSEELEASNLPIPTQRGMNGRKPVFRKKGPAQGKKGSAGTLKPEQVIPLDDSDFKNF